jgi:hypothetical protein
MRCQRQFTPQPSQLSYQGTAFELTQLNVKNDAWWGVAFEMADADSNQLDNFESMVEEVSKAYQGPELLAKNSFAYPTWLSLAA